MIVAILTMFNGLAKTYSLVSVVEEQLSMLLDAGVAVKLLVSEDCPDSERYGVFLDERLEWVKVTNRIGGEQMHWRDYSGPAGRVHAGFFAEADAVAADLERILRDVDVCLLHDILYQGWHLVHNVAVRQAQTRLPNTRFVAFTHSLPANPPSRPEWPFSARFTPMPNTIYVYPTQSGIKALARQYGVPEDRCRVVPNSFDPLSEAGDDAVRLARETDLYTPDVLIAYPGRLTPGKQFGKAAALAGALRTQTDWRVKIVFCDFPSMDAEPQAHKRSIREEGRGGGLTDEDIVFTSDAGWPDGFPHRGVMDLFSLTNLFVCSSYSESFGLIVLEAASRGNLLVLNEAVPALEELGRRLQAYFLRWNARNFGYDTRESYHPSEQAYLLEHASAIAQRMRDNPVLQAKTLTRQQYNPRSVWASRLAPLLFQR